MSETPRTTEILKSGASRETMRIKLGVLAMELERLINTPEIDDFLKGVRLEAVHQRERWGTPHDREKSAEHWYWLVGYLSGKALRAAIDGDKVKALHHSISSAAALMHWHAAICGDRSGEGLGQDADLEAHDAPPTGGLGAASRLSVSVDLAALAPAGVPVCNDPGLQRELEIAPPTPFGRADLVATPIRQLQRFYEIERVAQVVARSMQSAAPDDLADLTLAENGLLWQLVNAVQPLASCDQPRPKATDGSPIYEGS